jgi:putative SOS response-associated peptidase YedK
MCGRFALYAPRSELQQRFALDSLDPQYAPRYNITPGSQVLTIRQHGHGRRSGLRLLWGLIPHWAKDATRFGYHTINARLETVAQKPTYRDSWHKRRCLIPANGFYEWQQRAQGGKQPWYIERPGTILALAGLWDAWAGDHETIFSCTIIVHEAPPALVGIHDRVPVVVPEAAWSPWLDPSVQEDEHIMALLKDQPQNWALRPVSRKVNVPGNEGAELLQPIPD